MRVQAAGEAVGVGVVLAVVLELADVDLADQGRDVLIVLVARFGLGDPHTAQAGGIDLGDRELGDLAVELVEPLGRPRRHDSRQAPAGNAVLVLEKIAEALGIEQAEGRFKHRLN